MAGFIVNRADPHSFVLPVSDCITEIGIGNGSGNGICVGIAVTGYIYLTHKKTS